MWKSDLGGSLISEMLCCVVTCHVKFLSLISVDFWEGQGWVGGGVFGLSFCQSNPYLVGNMKGKPCWIMLSV